MNNELILWPVNLPVARRLLNSLDYFRSGSMNWELKQSYNVWSLRLKVSELSTLSVLLQDLVGLICAQSNLLSLSVVYPEGIQKAKAKCQAYCYKSHFTLVITYYGRKECLKWGSLIRKLLQKPTILLEAHLLCDKHMRLEGQLLIPISKHFQGSLLKLKQNDSAPQLSAIDVEGGFENHSLHQLFSVVSYIYEETRVVL